MTWHVVHERPRTVALYFDVAAQPGSLPAPAGGRRRTIALDFGRLVAGVRVRLDFAGLFLTPGALDLGVDLLPQFAARPTFGDGKPVQEIGLAQPGQVGVGPPPLERVLRR